MISAILFLLHVAGIFLLLGLACGWALAALTRRRAFLKTLSQKQQTRNQSQAQTQAQGQGQTQGHVGDRRTRDCAQGNLKGGRCEDRPTRPNRLDSTRLDDVIMHDDVSSNGGGPRELPKVALVMPARGKGEHLLANWQSQVQTDYRGRVQAYITVGAQKDPAYAAALSLKDSHQGDVSIEVVVAGPARSCSQKIQNQMAGFRAAPGDTDYILFLDDDIELTPSTVGSFVQEMEARPDAFLVTGYPLDIPSTALASYATAAFHLPLSIVFSFDGRAPFVWGGFMMFRGADLRSDALGVVSSLRDGGYSDDMSIGAIASGSGRLVLCPGYALFLQRLPSAQSLADTWHYLRRQVFTCTTYSSLHNMVVNQCVMWLHCALSLALVVSVLRSAFVALLLLTSLTTTTITTQQQAGWSPSRHDAAVTLAHVASLLVCASCLRAAQRNGILLCCSLQGVDLSSKKVGALMDTTSPWRVWLGLLVMNAMYPACAVVAFCNPRIMWSGIEYVRSHGKVSVHH